MIREKYDILVWKTQGISSSRFSGHPEAMLLSKFLWMSINLIFQLWSQCRKKLEADAISDTRLVEISRNPTAPISFTR